MSTLSNKYGIPTEAVNKMIKDGVISCSWITYQEIYAYYKKIRPNHSCKTQAMDQVVADMNVSRGLVHKCIEKFE